MRSTHPNQPLLHSRVNRVEDLTSLNRVERVDRVEDSGAGAPPQTPNASQSPTINPHSGHGAEPHLQIIFAPFAFFAAKIIPTPSTSNFSTLYTIYTFYTVKNLFSTLYTIYTFYTVILSPRAWTRLNHVAWPF